VINIYKPLILFTSAGALIPFQQLRSLCAPLQSSDFHAPTSASQELASARHWLHEIPRLAKRLANIKPSLKLLTRFAVINNSVMAPEWICDCCCESFRDYTSINIDGNSVCIKCVKQMFDKALKFEHNYPPKWSGRLHPSEFGHILSADYIAKYEDKEVEYNTPPNRRVYCQYDVERIKESEKGAMESCTETCGAFLGVRRKFIKDDILVFGRCKDNGCAKVTCMVCDYYCNNDAQNMLQHICLGKSQADEKRTQAFSGLKRGKDWQQCPDRRCQRRVELSEACNHISCQCGMGFCFICGKEADGESDHWRKGGCPRYNQPGDPDVEYDDYDGEDDDDDDRVSTTDEHDGGESEADVLENIRDLFETDEHTVESSVDLTRDISGYLDTRSVAAAMASRWTARTVWTDLLVGQDPTRRWITDNLPVGERIVVERLVEEGSPVDQHLGETSTVDHLVEGNPVVDQQAAEVEKEPATQELIAIAPNDAEAIASAFWEDDMSDDGHYNSAGPSPPGSPVITSEEADIDSALWRMAVE
jgi:hypothetical protein